MIIHGDCKTLIKGYADNSIDCCVCDPPYELGFMNKHWDSSGIAYDINFWREVYRVLKPGAYLLAFGGTRTYHRLACAIEDAGFEIRDMIEYLYGSGFPKALDVSKAIDKLDAVEMRRKRDLEFTAWMRSTGITAKQINDATNSFMGSHYLTEKEQPAVATLDMFEKIKHLLPEPPANIMESMRQRTIESRNFAEREIIGKHPQPASEIYQGGKLSKDLDLTLPATPEAKYWEGWKSALKPAHEPICVARKPLDGTIAENCMKWGVGAMNIDGGRIESNLSQTEIRKNFTALRPCENKGGFGYTGKKGTIPASQGRYPANLILDEVSSALLDEQSGILKSGGGDKRNKNTKYCWHSSTDKRTEPTGHEINSGGASRFFYCAKSSRSERNAGLEGMEERRSSAYGYDIGLGEAGEGMFKDRNPIKQNHHPTVKPISLMKYLINLVSREGQTVLDPFTGSGTTGIACALLNREFIGFEQDKEYVEIAEKRIEYWGKKKAEQKENEPELFI